MKTETVKITNKSGSEIKLSFDSTNLLDDGKNIGLRIPMRFGLLSRVIVIHASKANYPTDESFLDKIDQFGKQQVYVWIQTSSDDSTVMPVPDLMHKWTITIQQDDEPKPKNRNA